jgi:hypothetical protein
MPLPAAATATRGKPRRDKTSSVLRKQSKHQNMPQSLRGQDWARVASGLALVRPCAAPWLQLL